MLFKFIEWSAKKMEEKGETWSAEHMRSLGRLVEEMTHIEAIEALESLVVATTSQMKAVGTQAIEHGTLWSQRENIEQALRAGKGELHNWPGSII